MKPHFSPETNRTCCQFRRLAAICLLAAIMTTPAHAQTSLGRTSQPPFMAPWTTLTGAWTARSNTSSAPGLPQMPLSSGYLSFRIPSTVVARGNYVYVADSGHRQIYRYDLSLQTLTHFVNFPSTHVSSMAVAPDLSLYVADLNGGKVLHFAVDGRQLQTFSNDMEIARPVAVLVDPRTGGLWVVDSVYNHVVAFNSLGRVISAQRSHGGRSIEAMAQGPDGLYLVDRLSRQVLVVGADGEELYSLGKGILKMPNAVAVDRFNRVFVSDSFDNTLKVFERGQLTATVGRGGAIPASFNRITSLSIDQSILYVADSLNGRIQTFHLLPPGHRANLDDE